MRRFCKTVTMTKVAVTVLSQLLLVLGKSIDYLWINTTDIGKISLKNDGLPTMVSLATDLGPYGIQIDEKAYITFEIRTCRDAFITLVGYNDNPAFQIVLGGDGDTLVIVYSLVNGEMTKTLFTYPEGILNCDEFRAFWLSWDNFQLDLGYGNNIFVDRFLSQQENLTSVKFEKIMINSGWGANGTWIIHNEGNPGGYFCGTDWKKAIGRLLQTLVVRSHVECCDYCNKNDNCQGYNHNSYSNECEILDGNQFISTSSDKQWRFFSKCLQGITACIYC